MPSQTSVREHRGEVADIVALAQAALVDSWGDLPLDDALATKSALTAAVTDLADEYGRLAASAGADWYSEQRAEAGLRGRVTPRLIVPLEAEQIAAGVGWAVSPLFGRAEPATALSRVSGVTQRLITNADRATILNAGERDREVRGWYRGASSNCCSWCAVMASRVSTSLYRTESTALAASHNNCRCFPVPVYENEAPDLPDYYDGFYDQYLEAATTVADENEGKYPLRAVLSEMRQQTGRR